MNRFLPTVCAAAALFAAAITSAQAQDISVSANLGVTNNYMWRGITQTDNDFAIQGGADLDFNNGLALGVWASNVDFGDSTDAEVDIYGSYSFPLTDMVSGSVGGIGYLYPGQPSGAGYNFFEANAGLDIDLDPVSLGGMIAWSPDNLGENTWDFEGTGSIGFADYFSVFGTVGYYSWESSSDYLYYIAGIGAEYENFGAQLYATGTDISGDDTEFVFAVTVTVP